jgi:hypothetical protein
MNSKNDGITTQPARRAIPPGRVVPALPLTMMKQKLAKAQPKVHASSPAQDVAKDTGSKFQEQNGENSAEVTPHAPATINGISTVSKGINGERITASQVGPDPRGDSARSFEVTSKDDSRHLPPQPEQNQERRESSMPKPAARIETRISKNELPPDFVPHENASRSAASSQAPPSLSSLHLSQSDAVHPGLEDSSSSPSVPPHSAGSSAFVPSLPPVPLQGHSHHFSEPQAPRVPPGYQQPPMFLAQRSGHNPLLQNGHNGIQNSQHHHRDSVHANGANPLHFQRTRAESQTSGLDPRSPSLFDQNGDSTNSMLYDGKSFFSPPRAQQVPPMHTINLAQGGPQNGFQYDHGDPLRTYLLSQFQDARSADCVLEVIHADGVSFKIEAHKLLLARSPTLHKLIVAGKEQTPKSSLCIKVPSKHIGEDSFTDSIRHLYGGPLPTPDSLRGATLSEKMAAALRYVAVGAYLRMDAISFRSMQLALGLLRWDAVPAALAFALEGGLGPAWDKRPRSSAMHSDNAYGHPQHDPYSTDLLHRLIDFMVHTIPQNFYIDPAAPQLPESPRFPSYSETSHGRQNSRHHPRLSQIRFGSITSEELQRPSAEATMISSILVSLPFPILQAVLEHPGLAHRLGPETAASVTRQVNLLSNVQSMFFTDEF